MIDAAQYVAMAGSIDLFVVRASRLALERSNDGRIRLLAHRLSEAHRGLAGQLSIGGRRLNVLPAARLLPREERRLAALKNAPAFDDAFLRQMIEVHAQSLALHDGFTQRGSSATLRPIAINAVQVERDHLAELRAR